MARDGNIFSGLKVVDLASFIAGPAATTILSDFGADVIKVEPPGVGDPHRYMYAIPPNPASEHNYAWQLTNRNKLGLALDLKNPAAREVLARLVRWADVLVTNFQPSVRRKLGLSYEEIAPLNPRLIYADITEYGINGTEADKPGFDVSAYWARTGLMQVTHDEGSPPTLPVPGIGDHAAASTLYSAIVTGLYRREKTGKGGRVTTSLIAEGAWAGALWIEGALSGAKLFGQHNRKSPPNPMLNPYRTADDRWLLLVCLQDKDFATLANAMGLAQLVSDTRFTSITARSQNAAALVEVLDIVFADRPLNHWINVFDEGRVIYSVVQVAQEIINDPQMIEKQILVRLRQSSGGARYTVNSPVQVAQVQKIEPSTAPKLGEHSVKVLQDLEFTVEQITQLRAAKAVVQAA